MDHNDGPDTLYVELAAQNFEPDNQYGTGIENPTELQGAQLSTSTIPFNSNDGNDGPSSGFDSDDSSSNFEDDLEKRFYEDEAEGASTAFGPQEEPSLFVS